MLRRIPLFLVGLLGCLGICLTVANAQKPASKDNRTILVDEEKDGLPGAKVGPSRKDIEDLIRAVNRDPVSDELFDRIDALFRPRWANLQKFDEVRARAIDPVFIAKIDAATMDLTKKKADSRTIIQRAALYLYTDDDATIRESIKEDLARENGPRKIITGRILDDDSGKPIIGAVILSQGDMLTRTDAKGEYSLKTRPALGQNLFFLMIEVPGYALTQTMLDWTDLADLATQNFRLPRSLVFGGRIIDSDGKPIVDAQVDLIMQANGTFRDGSLEKHDVGGSYTTFRAQTEADGTYAFRNIPPDNSPQQWAYTLTASHPKYQTRLKRYWPNEFLGTGWEITLETGFRVRGVVVDEAGKPVANAHVTAQYNPATVVWPVRTTDVQGRFQFDNLPQLPVQLIARSYLYVYTSVDAQAEKGEPTETKITVGKGEYFEGKVVDMNDKPVAGIMVGYLIPVNANGEIPQNRASIGSNRNTTTREDGTFRLGPIIKGRYRIRAIQNNSSGTQNGYMKADSGSKDLVIKLGVNGQ